MNKVYPENIKYIKDINMKIYEKVANTNIETVKIGIGKKGVKNILKHYNGNDIHIHSSYDTYAQAKCLSKYAFEEESDIILVFGLGLGYEFREMRKKNINKKYYVVEPDIEIFKTMFKNVDAKALLGTDGNVMLCVGQSYEETIQELEYLIAAETNTSIRIVILPAYNHLYKELIDKLLKGLKQILDKVTINLNTNILFNDLWIKNLVLNLKQLKYSYPVSMLNDSFKDKPAIIVGAGPSLTYNLEHLKKIYNKAIIVPCGSGMSVLEKNGIKAHIAGAMDGQKGEEDIFENLEKNKDISLFFSSQVYYTIPEKTGGHKFLINQTLGDNLINNNLDWNAYDAYSGFSITTVMVYNLAKLGCNPIIFLGQDMCYSENKIYADGATFYSEISSDTFNSGGYIKVKNRNEEDVYTLPGFLELKRANEEIIKGNPQIHFLNGTKNGLNMIGAENIDFNEYVDNTLINKNDYDIQTIIQEECHKNESLCKSTKDFISSLQQQNEETRELVKEIIMFFEEEHNDEKIKKFIARKENELKDIKLYNDYLKHIVSAIEVIYKERKELDARKQVYLHTLHKCNIINKCFKYGGDVDLMVDEERIEPVNE